VQLHASAISAWEIAIKVHKGKLGLPSAPRIWWETFLYSYGVNEVAVTGTIAMNAVEQELPHADPADRIIVATARSLGAQLVTADNLLRKALPFAIW
jgi:PIN domain nuclease of toxin-antitoxin system